MSDPDAEAEALLAKMRPFAPSAAPGQNMLPPNTRRDVPGLYAPSPVWRAGEGAATLFVHGWDDSHRVWRRFVQHFLQHQLPLLLIDLPGHGASKAELCLWPQAGQSVFEVCAAEGPIDTIIAHSFGCMASMRAIELGAVAGHLVLIAPPLDPARNWSARQRQDGASDAALVRAAALYKDRTGFEVEGFDAARALAGFTGRLLIIGSAADEDCPVEPMRTLAGTVPGAQCIEFDDISHRDLALDIDVFGEIQTFLGHD